MRNKRNIFSYLRKISNVAIIGLLLSSATAFAQNTDTDLNLTDHDAHPNRMDEMGHHEHGISTEQGKKEFMEMVEHPSDFSQSFPAARFVENKGQWNANILYRAELIDGYIYLENDGLKYHFYNGSSWYDNLHEGNDEFQVAQHAVKLNFKGANADLEVNASVTYQEQHQQSYFYGDKHISNVQFYQEVAYNNVYPNIDIIYHSFNDHLKYDINVLPGGDVNNIVMAYEGADHIYVHESGALIIETSLGAIAEYAPYTYQTIDGVEVEVKSNFIVVDNEVTFEFPEGYDETKTLIIDPDLVASTYTGSTSDNWGFTAAHTAAGKMVVAGVANGGGYPTTPGAFSSTYSGGTNSGAGGLASDITISIFSADGTTLDASTYVGGSDDETPHSLFIDPATDEVFLMGKTRSDDFPVTVGAHDEVLNTGVLGDNDEDIFIAKLDADLTTMEACTYVGGAGVDGANVNTAFAGTPNTKFSYGDAHRGQIIMDDSGDLYVTSSTRSSDFPTTVGAFDTGLSGTQDAIVFKIDNDLTTLDYSTYLGGSDFDAGFGLVEDGSGAVYVVGATESTNFPSTGGVINTASGGGVDGFLTLLSADGSTNTATTYLGTGNKDGAFYVALDEAGDPVVYGLSTGGAYPITVGTYSDASSSQFLHGLSTDLTTTNFSTVFGSGSANPNINPTGFQVDSCGKIIVGGWGRTFETGPLDGFTTGMSTTVDAFQPLTDGADFYFAVFGVDATSLVYATFFGETGGTGDHVDGGSSTFDERGIIYQAVCASCGGTGGFPTTGGAYSSTNGSTNCNNAVFKFDLDTYSPNAAGIAVVGIGCLGIPVDFTNTSGGAVSYEWDFGDGSPVSTDIDPSHTYSVVGTYTIQLVAFNPDACITSDTTTISIDIEQPTVTVTTDPIGGVICDGDNVTLTGAGAVTYEWTPGPFVGNPYIDAPVVTTTYEVIGTDADGCKDTVSVVITVTESTTTANAGADQTICLDPATATLDGNDPAVGTGAWTVIAGGGTITDPSLFNSGITGLTAGVNTFRWTIENAPCAESFDEITITVDESPTTADAGADQTLCLTPGTAILDGNDPAIGTGAWTVISGGGTVTDPSLFNSGITGLTAGANTFRWTVSSGVCADSFDEITITVNEEPTTADAGADQTVCSDPGTATLAGNDPAIGTGTWTVISGGGSITDPTLFNSGITGLTVGVNTFRWTVENTPCPDSFDEITITVDEAPTTADAGADQTLCLTPGTATLDGNDPAIGTGAWTVISGGGTVTDPSLFNSGITGLTAGANTFRWTVSSGVCADSFDEITITVNEEPTTADAGADQTVCSDPGTATLAGNDPAIGAGTWTVISGGGTITDPTLFNSGITGLTVGVNTFRWTIESAPCAESFDEITITVDESPTTADAGADQTLCLTPGTATLDGNDPAIGTGAWTVISGGGTVTDPSLFNSGITGLTAGANTFRWTISSGVCADSFDEITITVNEEPTTADAGADQTVCVDPGTANLAGNDPAIGTGTWTVITGGGTITDPTLFNSGVTGLTVGVNTFRWTIENAPCPDSFDEITITVEESPTVADAGADQEVCITPGTATLDGNDPAVGTGTWTVITGGGTITDPLLFNSGITGLTVGVNTFRWTISNGTCADSFDEVIIVVFEDTDGDAICDNEDIDDDNDGILDTAEGGGDTDGDGIPDSLDLDSDNDGIPDIVEAGGVDTDGDGRVDDDTDTDGDGYADTFDPDDGGTELENPDSDGDGVDDVVDLDSDNDGTPDIIEAGGDDTDGDGIVDDLTDTDGDGYVDLHDTDDGGTPLDNADTDGDGLADRIDLDSDNDGIPDVIENGGTDADGDGVIDGYVDADGDGFADEIDTTEGGTTLPTGDADLDGIPNYLDLDSDNDGILDLTEAGGTDTDGDGMVDGFTDVDADGFDDSIDTTEGGTSLPTPNTDGTGGPDYLDIDADGDGIPDNIEGQASGSYTAATDSDTDGDGIDDAYDIDDGGTPIGDYDHDGDGTPDYQDLDADGDGESDLIEGHDTDGDGTPETVPSGTDADGDGLDDAFDTIILDPGTTFTNAGNGTTDPLTDDVLADADNPDVGDLDFRENDTDGDGIDDAVDIDDDNDGILDTAEGDGDSDGDGIPDRLDLDSDNDGIPDIIEAGGVDTDGDGRVDDDTDTDGDGYADTFDPDDGGTELENPDSDGDGVSDATDLDSDNDGTPDIIEAGGVDTDGDGRVDDPTDTNGDGLADLHDTDDGGTPLDNPDTDGDGLADRIDLDSDNDGIPDVIENGGTDDDGDGVIDDIVDADGDGFADEIDTTEGGTTLPTGDADMDGIPNYLDLDSDNDGILDITEAGGTDTDGDGMVDGFTDVDADGFDDSIDTTEGGTSLPTPNTDGTGGADYLDIDADGDGIPDNLEGQPSDSYTGSTGTDTDGDGIDDAYDIDDAGTPIDPYDHDGDGTPDYQDLDSDNDGESDLIEGHDIDGDGIPDIVPSGTDADGDGLDDAFDTIILDPLTTFTNAGNGTADPLTDGVLADADVPGVGDLDFRENDSDGDGIDDSVDLDDDNDGIPDLEEGDGDTDGDGIPDSLDLDSDNDGIPDIIEAGGTDDDGDGVLDDFVDTDGDGLGDEVDTDDGGTPLDNPDSDGDGIQDTQDLDSDNDGTPDVIEAGGTDDDGDGIIDDFVDVDGDGFADEVDTTEGGTPLDNPDTDGDGVPNVLDLDSDNDGIPDVIENGGTDDDGDGVIDDFVDVDGDGFADEVDTTEGGTPLDGGDADMDGIPNYLDLDSDNDGILDLTEAGGTDADGDGMVDGFTDVDGDGFDDSIDTTEGGTSLPTPNTDGTGGPDYLDIDADGDGIPDNVEGQPSDAYTAATGIDTDGDGIDDAYDVDEGGAPIGDYDHDLDGTPDYQDLDSDNDGESDLIEGHDLDGDGTPETVPLGTDADGDGLDDAFDTVVLDPGTTFTNAGNGTIDPLTDGVLADADEPGVGNLDFRESDSDGDGIDDAIDLDDDNDGILDTAEGDGDSDGDGIPDSLDLDSDNDGIPDIIEAGGVDTDGDGRVDDPTDTDGDGYADTFDPDDGGTELDNPDSDGDGLNDAVDLDSDNDGTPDIVEAGGTDIDGDGIVDDLTDTDGDGFADLHDTDDGGTPLDNPDTDGDGVDDRIDLDSDNDGIPDVIENGGTDADGDGVIDDFVDADGDGFADEVDTTEGGTPLPRDDFDRDGIPNSLDLDSDNDGILDLVEAGGTDADGDGMVDGFTDVDGDGFDDSIDTTEGGTTLPTPNTDGNGGPDYLDIDADDDGIPDNVEGQPSDDYTGPTGTDTDGDGIDDAYDIDSGGTPIDPEDTDSDGEPDYQDLDSDNDGESDLIEGHDLDGDGVPDTVPTGTDSDGDGLDDAFDTVVLDAGSSFTNAGNGTIDPLTDGVLADADIPGAGDLDYRENFNDNDGDGIPDDLDLDDDNDGIPDTVEDLNEDGDGDPNTNPSDTDGDGIPDIFDLDSDNDGIPDIIEAGGTDDNGDGRVDDLNEDGTLINDTDNDGLDDLYDADNGGTDIPNPDTDGDGNPDFQDLDSDNDGIYDRVEDGGVDEDNDGQVDDWADEDGDGIPDYADADQTGGPDVDGDGIDDTVQFGDDEDGDGIGDDYDEDPDGDGWDDDDATDGSEDTDGDGVEDRLDLDSDNDGVPDIIEDGGTDEDGDGRIDDFTDEDGDGADDDDMTDGLTDTDGDGVPDHEDLDSDNDGITDAEENGVPDEDGDGVIDDFNDEDGDGWDDDDQVTDPVDTDGDGNPDYTDLDSDDDGIDDIIEGGGVDEDGDGTIDDFEDDNGDGLDDDGGVDPPDTDGDGIDDYQDTDSDNDGVNDDEENDPDGDGEGPDDTDGDGIPDYQDTDDDGDNTLTEDELDEDENGIYDDCDGDGIPDYLDPDPCGISIPTGFSPNNDGTNDFFVIDGIENNENVSITIFNRWGSTVYKSDSYQNDWEGTYEYGTTLGSNELPVGTYFYIIDLGDGSEVIKNYLQLQR